MSNRKLIIGIVIGVIVTGTFCYVIYLLKDRERLSDENDLFRQREKDNPDDKIISINSVPKIIRNDFEEAVRHNSFEDKKETFISSLNRVKFLKNIIENRDGYRLFYHKQKPITKETDLHILYDCTWFETDNDVNKEVNNGRGPVDFKVSSGRCDQTIIEFKLASNPHLKNNLERQVEIYAKANHNPDKIVAIIFMSERDEAKLKKILKDLNLENRDNVISIDARMDNKPSASVA